MLGVLFCMLYAAKLSGSQMISLLKSEDVMLHVVLVYLRAGPVLCRGSRLVTSLRVTVPFWPAFTDLSELPGVG